MSSLTIRLILALLAGAFTGHFWGPQVQWLGELGMLLIKFLKALAAPLVFFAIVDGFLKTHIPLKRGIMMLSISALNAVVAATIALSLSHMIPAQNWIDLQYLKQAMSVEPSQSLQHSTEAPPLSILALIKSTIPASLVEPFAMHNIIAIVFLAVLLGSALRKLKDKDDDAHDRQAFATMENLIHGVFRVLVIVLDWIIQLVPLAVFGVIAKIIGASANTNGLALSMTQSWGFFFLLVASGLSMQVFIYYPLLLLAVTKQSPLRFFKHAALPLSTALSTGSSLATLPITLKTLQGPLKVSSASARLAACIGSNFNHDGILLYEAVAALFVAKVFGITLTFYQQILLVFTSTLAAIGIAGIPEAGLITLSLVLSAVGLPLTAVPVLLPIDWLIGRLRAMTNVASDMVVAFLLDHLQQPTQSQSK